MGSGELPWQNPSGALAKSKLLAVYENNHLFAPPKHEFDFLFPESA